MLVTHLSVGRDYNRHTGYEYCLWGEDDANLVARESGFKSKAAAVKAGKRHAESLNSKLQAIMQAPQ